MNAAPQYSPDGKFYWNGTAWVPVAPPKKKGHPVRWVFAIVGGIALLSICVSAVQTSPQHTTVSGLADSKPSSAPATASKTVPVTLVASVAITDTDKASVPGTTVPGAAVAATWTSGSTTATADPGGAFTLQIGPVAEGTTEVKVTVAANGYSAGATRLEVTRTTSPAAYKASAASIPYVQLEKDPSALAGRVVTYTAQVVQYDSNTTTSHFRANVTADSYGYYSDTVWVDLDPSIATSVFRNTIVRVWGTVVGPYTYTTTSGGQVTIPEIKVRFLEVVQ